MSYTGFVRHVRIVSVQKGRGRLPHQLFFGPIDSLTFDPRRWRWNSGLILLDYTASAGRKFLSGSTQLSRSTPSLLPDSFLPSWRDTWFKARSQKEAAFIWSIWHNAVAVNSWHTQIAPGMDTRCLCCSSGDIETPLHRFFTCPRAQEIWDYAQTILHYISGSSPALGPHARLDSKQCIFGTPIPRKFHNSRTIWSLVRGAALWLCWIMRNHLVFAQDRWPTPLLHKLFWDVVLDNGRASLLRTVKVGRRSPQHYDSIWSKFDSIWLHSTVLANRSGSSIIWSKEGPPPCTFY